MTSDFAPLISALKKLLSTGIDFIKALVEVLIQLFQIIVELVKAGANLLP